MLFLSATLVWTSYRAGFAAGREVQAEGPVVLGEEEWVQIGTGEESLEVLAKIDTGAGYSSIDEDLAEELGIDLKNPEDRVEIESANGEEVRPLVRVRLRVAGETFDTRVTVTDHSELTKAC